MVDTEDLKSSGCEVVRVQISSMANVDELYCDKQGLSGFLFGVAKEGTFYHASGVSW